MAQAKRSAVVDASVLAVFVEDKPRKVFATLTGNSLCGNQGYGPTTRDSDDDRYETSCYRCISVLVKQVSGKPRFKEEGLKYLSKKSSRWMLLKMQDKGLLG